MVTVSRPGRQSREAARRSRGGRPDSRNDARTSARGRHRRTRTARRQTRDRPDAVHLILLQIGDDEFQSRQPLFVTLANCCDVVRIDVDTNDALRDLRIDAFETVAARIPESRLTQEPVRAESARRDRRATSPEPPPATPCGLRNRPEEVPATDFRMMFVRGARSRLARFQRCPLFGDERQMVP